jgi:hypothetical protein
MVCSKKREYIFNRAKRGEKKFDKIIHNQEVNEFVTNKTKLIINKINQNKNTQNYGFSF